MVGAGAWGRGMGSYCLTGAEFQVCRMAKSWSWMVVMLLSPSLYCSLHNRPVNRGMRVGARDSDFIQKPEDQEDGGLVSQRTIFPRLEVRLLLY